VKLTEVGAESFVRAAQLVDVVGPERHHGLPARRSGCDSCLLASFTLLISQKFPKYFRRLLLSSPCR
jgi:hypothetical protein